MCRHLYWRCWNAWEPTWYIDMQDPGACVEVQCQSRCSLSGAITAGSPLGTWIYLSKGPSLPHYHSACQSECYFWHPAFAQKTRAHGCPENRASSSYQEITKNFWHYPQLFSATKLMNSMTLQSGWPIFAAYPRQYCFSMTSHYRSVHSCVFVFSPVKSKYRNNSLSQDLQCMMKDSILQSACYSMHHDLMVSGLWAMLLTAFWCSSFASLNTVLLPPTCPCIYSTNGRIACISVMPSEIASDWLGVSEI